MRLEIRLDRRTPRKWHAELAGRLQDAGVEVGVRSVEVQAFPGQAGWERVLRLERLLHGIGEGLLAREQVEESLPDGWQPDVVLDLTPTPSAGSWTVRYGNGYGEPAAAAALRAGGFPRVSVIDGAGEVRAEGRPGSEMPGLFVSALADLSAGVITLIVGAVTGSPFAPPADGREHVRRRRSLAEVSARRVIGSVVRRAYRLLYRTPHWRVGWRRVDDAGAVLAKTLPSGPWQDLADDGHRFYADPFPFEHDGSTYLFVEDFDHAVGRAVISVVRWADDGPDGAPVPVLAHEVHLSYPFVLEHDGDVWMIPETSGAKTVELYRAVEFPWKWERHSILLEGVEASDTTPFEHDGRWWLSATVGNGGSLSDSLCLWSAPDLRGPWTPHANNPVLIDIASARPAGRVVMHEGRLLRPVQDCSDGYGAALAVAEITRLDDEGFQQKVVQRFVPGDAWPGTRLHTLNTGGGIETIDGSAFAPRLWGRGSGASPESGYSVQREDDLDFLGEEYRALYVGSGASAFQDGVWLDGIYRVLAPARGARRCVVTMRTSDGRLVGVLPLLRRRAGLARLVEYADLGVSDYVGPVLDTAHAHMILADSAIARRVRRALGAFDLFLANGVLDAPGSLTGLVAGSRARMLPYGAHLAKLDVDVATWRNGLSPKVVRHLDKHYRRLRPKGGTGFREVSSVDEVDELFETLRSFRAARFGERGGLDLMQDPDCFAFYRDIARRGVAGEGPGKLVVLEVGGRPGALALDLVERDREVHLIVGYDFQGLRNFSLGMLIVDQIAQNAISHGLRALDLTVGDEHYKAQFGAVRRPLFSVHLARTPIGHAVFRGELIYRWARRRAKAARDLTRATRKRLSDWLTTRRARGTTMSRR